MSYPVITPEPGSLIVDIPFPYKQFTDTAFFITDTGNNLLIPDNCYKRIDDNRIMITEPELLEINDHSEFQFTFIHNKNRRWIGKEEIHFTIKKMGQTEVTLPITPYNRTLNISKRMQVFYNRVRLAPGKAYSFNNNTGKIKFLDRQLTHIVGDRIDVLMIYSSGNDNSIVQELPESGYIYLSKTEIDRNYNNNLMAVFLNGKLVPKEEIIQMSNTIYKIKTDKNSRYNLEVKGMSPRINSLVPYYKKQYWEEDAIKHEIFKDFQCRIDVPQIDFPKGRQIINATFNPVYFEPTLLEQPNVWINFIKRAKTHTYPENENMEYKLTFFGDDYTDDPCEILVIMQLRLRDNKKLIMNDPTALLVAKVPSVITQTDEDYIYNSFQISNLVHQDTFRNKLNVDSIIGFLQPDYNDPEKPLGVPVYVEVTSNKMEELTTIGLFEWTVTTEENNKGVCLWKKHIDIEPDNKKQILRIGDDING